MMNELYAVCLIDILINYILIHLVTVYFGYYGMDYFTHILQYSEQHLFLWPINNGLFYLKSTNAIENCFPDVGSVKTATSECMIANCLEPGEHHLELRKPSPLWGTYQLKKVNIGDIKYLEICEGHMKKEAERHTWALTSMAKLTVQELDCYLCKKKSVYTNTTRHCVKHMICVAEESCHVPCDFFDMNDGHFIHSRHSSNHFVCHSIYLSLVLLSKKLW